MIESVIADREAALGIFDRVARSIADDVIAGATFAPDTDAAIRESLVRQRLAAAAERQCHTARAFVLEVYVDPAPGGEAQLVIATPTGDRREERELLIEGMAAWAIVKHEAARDLGYAAIVCFLFGWLLGPEAP